MIAHVFGRVSDKQTGRLVVDVSGIGYAVQVSLNDWALVSLDQTVKLYTYHHIREQSQELFGFLQPAAKQLFEQLLSVKNVGPKVALAVLDIGSVEIVRNAVASGDVKKLQQAKGVGKRAAEQIVVELRDKIGLPTGEGADSIIGRSGVDESDEAVQALVSLGYSDVDAQLALQTIDKALSTEERIKQALRK
ncbi:MAG: Holliday junction branch migration protein RuvA [Segetibacter sp.]